MQPAPSCPLCVGHMHTSYYFFVICSEMGNRCSDVSKHVQTQTTETVFTQEDAPSSSLDVSAFSSVLCQDDPTVFVCWGRPIHDGQTSSLCFFLCAFTALTVWPVAGVYQMFVGLTLCPLSSTRWGHTVLRSAMFSALFESTCWCKNSILCQTVVPFMVSTSLSSHLWSYNIKIWNVHRDV